ncbi:MAG: hypothetical protein WBE45_12400 [Terriglobales bacterium]|jgi:hypothetical protein
MSRQFYLYLLPADVESLVHTLRSKLGISLIQSSSPRPIPLEMESPICKGGLQLKTATVRVDCYLTPSREADIRMRFVPILSRWNVQTESEAIEFSGCEFDGSVLVRGRFYFQNDLLVGGMIVPKRKEFLTWADKVFRLTKKSLHRSTTLDVYVDEHAEKWRQEGGRFAWTTNSVRGPIYEAEADSVRGDVK